MSVAFQQSDPSIPWREVTGMRHRLIYGYADVGLELVWIVVRDRLVPLIAMLAPLVPPA